MAQTFEAAGVAGKEFIDSSLKSFAAVSKSMQALTAGATDYSKKSLETGSAAMEKLFASKSLEKAIEVQAEYARNSYESFVAEATKVGEIYAEMAKEAYKPYERLLSKAK